MQAIPFSISRGITNRATLAAMREAERIADDPEVPEADVNGQCR